MVQGRLEISARKNPLEVSRKSARVPPADSARKNPLEVSRKSARVPPADSARKNSLGVPENPPGCQPILLAVLVTNNIGHLHF